MQTGCDAIARNTMGATAYLRRRQSCDPAAPGTSSAVRDDQCPRADQRSPARPARGPSASTSASFRVPTLWRALRGSPGARINCGLDRWAAEPPTAAASRATATSRRDMERTRGSSRSARPSSRCVSVGEREPNGSNRAAETSKRGSRQAATFGPLSRAEGQGAPTVRVHFRTNLGPRDCTRPGQQTCPDDPHANTLPAQISLMSGPVGFTNGNSVRCRSRAVT